MLKYVLKRVGMAVITIFITITITFFLMNAVPGNPFAQERQNEVATESLKAKYGLNVSVGEQYINYLKKSYKRRYGGKP